MNTNDTNDVNSKYSGIIKTFFSKRLFGFIRQDDGKDVFFHQTNFEKGVPKLGQRVEFELGDPVSLGQNKQAVNVRVINEAFDVLATSTTSSNEVSK